MVMWCAGVRVRGSTGLSEDAGRVPHDLGRRLLVCLGPGHRMKRPDRLDTQLAEHGPVALTRLQAERGRGADDRDRRIRTTGQRDEATQDDAVADLVLRAADDDDGSIGHRLSIPRSDSREDTRRRVFTDDVTRTIDSGRRAIVRAEFVDRLRVASVRAGVEAPEPVANRVVGEERIGDRLPRQDLAHHRPIPG